MAQVKINAELLNPVEKKVLSAVADDLAALRASFVALTAKLDTNHGAATDHAATLNPVALSTTK